MKKLILFLSSLIVVGCGTTGSSDRSLKHSQFLKDNIYATCWMTTKSQCRYYKKDKDGNFDQIGFHKDLYGVGYYDGLVMGKVKKGNNSFDIVPVEIFGSNGELLDSPIVKPQAQGKKIVYETQMALSYDSNCHNPQGKFYGAGRNSHSVMWVPDNQRGKCSLTVYTKMASPKTITPFYGFRQEQETFAIYKGSDPKKTQRYGYYSSGELIVSPDRSAVNITKYGAFAWDKNTLYGKRLFKNRSEKDNETFVLEGEKCKLKATHANHPKYLNMIVGECSKGSAIFNDKGEMKSFLSYDELSPYLVSHEKRSSDRHTPFLPRSFMIGKQKNGKFAVVAMTQNHVSEIPEFNSATEARVFAAKMNGVAAPLHQPKGWSAFNTDVAKFNYKGEDYQYQTSTMRLLPKGDYRLKSDSKNALGRMSIAKIPGDVPDIYVAVRPPANFNSAGTVYPTNTTPDALGIRFFESSIQRPKSRQNYLYSALAFKTPKGVRWAVADNNFLPKTEPVCKNVTMNRTNFDKGGGNNTVYLPVLVCEQENGKFRSFVQMGYSFVGMEEKDSLRDSVFWASRVVRSDTLRKERIARMDRLQKEYSEKAKNASNLSEVELRLALRSCVKELGEGGCQGLSEAKEEADYKKWASQQGDAPKSYSNGIDVYGMAGGFIRNHNAAAVRSINANTRRLQGK